MSVPPTIPGSSSITFVTGDLAGQTFQITSPVTTIGRETSNDIVVKGDLQVSRHHARLSWKHGVWNIENLSQNASLSVDEYPVKQAIIQDKSLIALSPATSFTFHTTQAAPVLLDELGTVRADLPDLQTVAAAEVVAPSQPPQPVAVAVAPASAPGLAAGLPAAAPPAVAAPPLMASPPPAAPLAPVAPSLVDLRGIPPGSFPRESQTIRASLFELGIPTLEVSSNTGGQHKLYPLEKAITDIGRDVSNDLVLEEPCVSALHIQIVREGDQFVLIHPHPKRRQTTNGLLFQGRQIPGNEAFRKVLAPGDLFRIGDEQGALVTLRYQDGSATPSEQPPLPPIRLGAAELTIGRKPDNTIALPHPQVSAYHARLVREGGAYRLLDLQSTNHVYVNAQPTTSHLLKMGDEIRIGPYRLVYETTQLTPYDETNNIRIDALNLKKVSPTKATLLNNISLSIPPRAFVALVGGSGAGKTTLLDALCGLRPAHEGKVLFNGQDYYRNLAAFNTQIGYVPQDDIVHRTLTVERALYYAARMRLPGDFTEEQIQQRIKEVLEDVELTERRKLLIKKLSGGQRKRVSIALELLANPSLFFLDEPTSGLDPGLDRKMMVLLRKLADKGHTIILVTHATNNISICDYICFLAPGGRLAYYGPSDGAKQFFDRQDFAEMYSSLEASEERPALPAEAEERFKSSQDYHDYIAEPLRTHTASAATTPLRAKTTKRPKSGKLFKQLRLLALRNMELLKNDGGTLFLMLLQAPMIALFLMLLVRFEIGAGVFDPNNVVVCRPQVLTGAGPVGFPSTGETVSCDRVVTFLANDPAGVQYAQTHGGATQALQDFILSGQGLSAQRVLFLCAFIAVLNGVLNAVREIVKESAIYRRERTVNLGILPYVLSKMLLLGLLALFQSGSLILIVNAFEPLHQGVFLPVLLETYITLALSALAGMMFGLLVSALAPNEDTAQSLLPFILIPQIIFAGVEIPLQDGITTTLALFFPTRWTMAGLGSSLGLHGDKLGGDKLLGSDFTYHGALFSTYTSADAMNRILLSWAALGMIILVFGLAVGLALKRKDSRG